MTPLAFTRLGPLRRPLVRRDLARFVLLASLCLAALPGCARPLDPQTQSPPKPKEQPVRNQAAVSPDIAAAAASITGDDVSRICQAMRYVGEHLAYDPESNREQFTKTAATLFSERILGGCSDFALADLALFKAMGYPARLVVTANVIWIGRFRDNPLALGNGHSFVEVYLGGRWHLTDPTHFVLYDGYDPAAKNLPSGEIFMARGEDFADIGISSVDQANAMLVRAAKAYQDDYRDPKLPVRGQVDFDFPATFSKLGEIFLDKNVTRSALRLCRKAADLKPELPAAQLCLTRAYLQTGEREKAASSLARAQKLDPQNPRLPALRRDLDNLTQPKKP